MPKEMTSLPLDQIDIILGAFVTIYSFFLDVIPGPIDNIILITGVVIVVLLRHKVGA